MEHLCKMMYKNVNLLKDTKSTVRVPSYTDSFELMSCIVDLAAAPNKTRANALSHGLMVEGSSVPGDSKPPQPRGTKHQINTSELAWIKHIWVG